MITKPNPTADSAAANKRVINAKIKPSKLLKKIVTNKIKVIIEK